ncbi:HAMP domain-containing histidine kinase [Enterococcus sp. 669A]|uniref:histidine kinase n=1 Tax=Candidatus Enterococcus moelleringii TaxID=2815325 RepID=A0ABS3LC01_9ENTE|nr:HAMP domain-containing sensor histidine kinase [Enterococcus sp. 669A]MBO1307163.1 HAMP domain-containing histidine kinase [Enterococcus sp. 669A]
MLIFVIIVLCCIIVGQFIYIRSNKKKVQEVSNILDEVADGNLDRRLLADEDTAISELVYKINDIIIQDKNRLVAANKSEKAYKELVTSLSHDLRTPLASLVGYLEELENDPDEKELFLRTAKNKALDLSDYIQSLFEWLKLESGEWVYHFESENIGEVTRIILADWVVKLEKCGIAFQFDIPEDSIQLITDKRAWERILNNLLSNILKHSQADFLAITLTYDSSEVLITISDNGIGIPEQDLPFIFDRLYKGDRSRSENSNGLGLAIVKELLTALGGTISVQSEIDEGTTFQLQLPHKHE